jgi:hypothetical protein
MTDATSGARSAYPFGAHVFSLVSGLRVARSFVFCVMFCRLLSVLCLFSFGHYIICPSSMSASDCSFRIFKLFSNISDNYMVIFQRLSYFYTWCIVSISIILKNDQPLWRTDRYKISMFLFLTSTNLQFVILAWILHCYLDKMLIVSTKTISDNSWVTSQ